MRIYINRRTFIKLGALASTMLYSKLSWSGLNLINTDIPQKTETYHFKVGDFDCLAMNDGYYNYEAKHFFINAPDDLLKNKLREHNIEGDLLPSPYTCLAVKMDNNVILIDTGVGAGLDFGGNLLQNLKAEKIKPEDIKTIILSHGHADHIGGITDTDGKLVFKNARFYMMKKEWEYWTSEGELKKESEILATFARKNLPPIKDHVELLDQDTEILPGMHVISAPGHTPGHMVVYLKSKGAQLLYMADTVLHPIHLEQPEWECGYDHDHEQAANTKRKIFDKAAVEKATVLAYHFHPFPCLGHVIKEGKGWKWQPV